MPLIRPTLTALAIGAGLLGLASCTSSQTATRALPPGAAPATRSLAKTKDALDAISAKHITPAKTDGQAVTRDNLRLTGVGFAQVSGQPGGTLNERRLMAIRAARLEALRDLAEQVHGIRLSATSTVQKTVMQNDELRGIVEGEIRGARTQKIEPRDKDTYRVVMSLEPDTVRYILRTVRGGR